MGNIFNKKKTFSRGQILLDIKNLNKITSSFSFAKENLLHLTFELDDSKDNKKTKKIIKITIYDYNLKTKIPKIRPNEKGKPNPCLINIESFYKYYYAVMNSKLNIKNSNSEIIDYDDEEDDLCPICLNKLGQIALPCNHVFCEKCIKEWIGINSICPMCRQNLEITPNGRKKDKSQPCKIKGACEVNLMNYCKNEREDIKNENEKILANLTWKMFY